MRPPFFVPETKPVSELMEELLRSSIHIGIVLDEYGGTSGVVTLDVAELSDWDTNLSASLWALLSPLTQRGLTLDLGALPAAVRAPLHLAVQAQGRPLEAAGAKGAGDNGLLGLIRESLSWHELRTTVAFVGELLLSIGRLRQRPRVFRLADLLHQMDEMGPRSLPIVALTTFLATLLLRRSMAVPLSSK